MSDSAIFLRNTWYVAAWSHELGADGMLARTITQMPLVFWRDRAGQVVALEDRCCQPKSGWQTLVRQELAENRRNGLQPQSLSDLQPQLDQIRRAGYAATTAFIPRIT